MTIPTATQRPILNIALAACLGLLSATATAQTQPQLQGAGARFPFPLYATWFKQFARDPDIRERWNSTGARVTYQPGGGEAGMQALIDATVDFIGANRPMDDAQQKGVERGVIALPITAGTIALAYHLPGVAALKLPRAVYPAIFTGAVTRWDDPAIAEANPDLTLPAMDIRVVVRADSAHASDVLSAHLSAIDAVFRRDIGRSTSPKWPQDKGFLSAVNNDGVAAEIARTPGAIGYLDHGYAKLAGWQQIAQIENNAGNYVGPSAETGAAALTDVPFPQAALPSGAPDLRAQPRDPEGEDAYPMTALTWMLFYATGYEGEQLRAVRDLLAFCTSAQAQAQAAVLGYVPLPETLLARTRNAAGAIE
jgi:phosphate transport system substrate-binding protein